jgi:hypothetical protein
LERLMAAENSETVVEGDQSKRYFDVWLAIDRGITWQPQEGNRKPNFYEWGNMVMTFYFPKKAFLERSRSQHVSWPSSNLSVPTS